MKLQEGQPAPALSLPDQNGKTHSLTDYKGRWVLLYFYPKDNTLGCTKEACELRDAYKNFTTQKTVVLGVSVDSVKSHKNFAEKFRLPFPILSDEKKEVVKTYGAWQRKRMAGREYMGTVRTSFLIDPKGTIAKIYEQVKAAGHATEVLRELKAHRKEY